MPSRSMKTTKKSAAAKKSAPTRSRNASPKPAAKKAATKKNPTKKPASKKPASKKPASKKPASKKTVSKKTVSKKSTSKKSSQTKKAQAQKARATKALAKKPAATKKPVSRKPTAKKKAVKKKIVKKKSATKKPGTSTPAPKKSVPKKAVTKKTASKSSAARSASTRKGASKPGPASVGTTDAKSKPAPGGAKAPAGGDAKKTGRKGITIVSDRKKKSRTKAPRKPFITPGGSLLGPGVVRKPLIPSGPKASNPAKSEVVDTTKPKKTPFNKRELTKFKNLLLIKRAEVFGDIEQMEADALRSNSGDLSNLPQHLADQGSDSYEQSLSLNLAAADRRLIKEIDDALGRIDTRTYGVCERSGKPIRKTRLQELPWARYSIEAAREMERRGGF